MGSPRQATCGGLAWLARGEETVVGRCSRPLGRRNENERQRELGAWTRVPSLLLPGRSGGLPYPHHHQRRLIKHSAGRDAQDGAETAGLAGWF